MKFRWLFSLTFVIFGLLTWPAFTAETHVKDYLPVGQPDGVSDNTAGIQNAINAALGTGGPLIVDAAPHIYLVTSNGVFGVLSPAVQNLSSSVTSNNNATGP